MTSSIVDPTLLFDVNFPLWKLPGECNSNDLADASLPESCELPYLGVLADRRKFATFRMAWSDAGIRVDVSVRNKRKPIVYAGMLASRNDGLRLWLDTRPGTGVQRATRYCMNFNFTPDPDRHADRSVTITPIPRARESHLEIDPQSIQVHQICEKDGYEIRAFCPGSVLTGWQPSEVAQLGVFYSIIDSEFGVQTPTVAQEMRYFENPSLWLIGQLANS